MVLGLGVGSALLSRKTVKGWAILDPTATVESPRPTSCAGLDVESYRVWPKLTRFGVGKRAERSLGHDTEAKEPCMCIFLR